jgi:NAD(P)-dependent dehydrogenase (short-subunit alcohol dehydrogenase family)
MAVVGTLLARGDDVIAIVPRPERVPALTDLLQDVGPRLQVVTGDATVGAGASELLARVGDCDVLLHLALRRQAADTLVDLEDVDALGGVTERDFATLVAANAWATVAWVRGAVPLLQPARDAKVLIALPWLASLAGKSHGGDYAYCASLAARGMVVRALAADLARERVTVAAVNPGNYKSDLEGPAFLHDVQTAAAGCVGVLDALAPGAGGSWVDWTGTSRAW